MLWVVGTASAEALRQRHTAVWGREKQLVWKQNE